MTFPYLERLASNPAIQLVGVSQDDASYTQQFNQRFGITFQTLLDPPAEGYPASNAYGISSVPSFFVVEPDGMISKSFEGFSKSDLEQIGSRAGRSPFNPDDKVPALKPG